MKLFNKYKFSDKSQTLGGMISTVMGLAALAFILHSRQKEMPDSR